MAEFSLFLPMLLRHEGGLVDHPSDPGGLTQMGISMATFKQQAKPLLGLDPTPENLKKLTQAQAGAIYRACYWNPLHCDDWPLQNLANIVCDHAVNAGLRRGVLLLQEALNNPSLVKDGVMGPATIQALRASDEVATYNACKQLRIEYYTALGQRMPMFLKGWLNRVNSFPDL